MFFFFIAKQLLNLWAGGSHVSIQIQQNSSNMLNHFMETSCPETQGRPPLAGSCLPTVCPSHTGGPGEDLQKPPPLQTCSSGAEEVGSAGRRWGTVSVLLPLCHISSEAENSQIWDHQSGPAAESAFLH